MGQIMTPQQRALQQEQMRRVQQLRQQNQQRKPGTDPRDQPGGGTRPGTNFNSTGAGYAPGATGDHKDLWELQDNFLKDILPEARNIYNRNVHQGPTPLSGTTRNALNQMGQLASRGNPLLPGAMNTVGAIASGRAGLNTGGMFQNIYGQSQGRDFLEQGMFGKVAEGKLVGSNPYREAALQASLADATKGLKASLSGSGRYGSGYAGDAFARGLGTVAANARMAGYDTDMGHMLGAAQARSGADLARMGVGLSAAQGKTDVQQQNLSNRMGASLAAPGLGAARYNDAQMGLQAGQIRDAQNQQRQNFGWDQLGRYAGLVQGGGTAQNATDPGKPNPWLSALGGAMGGGQMFGLPGAIGGGLLGGLSSFF